MANYDRKCLKIIDPYWFLDLETSVQAYQQGGQQMDEIVEMAKNLQEKLRAHRRTISQLR